MPGSDGTVAVLEQQVETAPESKCPECSRCQKIAYGEWWRWRPGARWKPKSITDHLKLWARDLIAFPFVMLGSFPYMFLWCTFWLPLQDRLRTKYINESVIAMAWLVGERTRLRHHENGVFTEAVRTYQLEDPDSVDLYELERAEKPDEHPNCTFIYLEEHGVQYAWEAQHLFGDRIELTIRSMLTFLFLFGWAGLNGSIYVYQKTYHAPGDDTDLVFSCVLPLCLAVVVQLVVGLAVYIYQHGCYFAGITKELPKYTQTPWRPVCPQHGRKSAIASQSAATANTIV